jgi:hypothetical protein
MVLWARANAASIACRFGLREYDVTYSDALTLINRNMRVPYQHFYMQKNIK